MRQRKPEEIVGGIVFLLIGLLFLAASLQLGMVSQMFFDTQPGAGYYPAILSVGLILLGGVLLGKGVYGQPSGQQAESSADPLEEGVSPPAPAMETVLAPQERRANIKAICLTIVVIALALFLWRFTGFYPAMILMCVVLNVVFRDSWLLNGLLTAGTIGFVYLAFTSALKITFRI